MASAVPPIIGMTAINIVILISEALYATRQASPVAPETPIQNLMPLLATGRAHEAMVVDAERRLIGVITQTDLLSTLYRAHVVEAVVAARAP